MKKPKMQTLNYEEGPDTIALILKIEPNGKVFIDRANGSFAYLPEIFERLSQPLKTHPHNVFEDAARGRF